MSDVWSCVEVELEAQNHTLSGFFPGFKGCVDAPEAFPRQVWILLALLKVAWRYLDGSATAELFVLVCEIGKLWSGEKGALLKMGLLGVHVSLRPAVIRHWMLLAKPVAQSHTGSSTWIRSKIIEQQNVSYKFWCGNKRFHQIFTPGGGTTPGTPSLSLSLEFRSNLEQPNPGCHDCKASYCI